MVTKTKLPAVRIGSLDKNSSLGKFTGSGFICNNLSPKRSTPPHSYTQMESYCVWLLICPPNALSGNSDYNAS